MNKIVKEKEYELISINDKDYIKEGLNIYKIKSGHKDKLYALMDSEGTVTKVKVNKSVNS